MIDVARVLKHLQKVYQYFNAELAIGIIDNLVVWINDNEDLAELFIDKLEHYNNLLVDKKISQKEYETLVKSLLSLKNLEIKVKDEIDRMRIDKAKNLLLSILRIVPSVL